MQLVFAPGPAPGFGSAQMPDQLVAVDERNAAGRMDAAREQRVRQAAAAWSDEFDLRVGIDVGEHILETVDAVHSTWRQPRSPPSAVITETPLLDGTRSGERSSMRTGQPCSVSLSTSGQK